MTTIGFDVSKNELVGVRTDRSAQPKQTFVIPNTKEDICDFFEDLSRSRRKVLVAAEATGEYHRALALECLRRQIPIRLLNPITTKRSREPPCGGQRPICRMRSSSPNSHSRVKDRR